jgi:hypothetical protein
MRSTASLRLMLAVPHRSSRTMTKRTDRVVPDQMRVVCRVNLADTGAELARGV